MCGGGWGGGVVVLVVVMVGSAPSKDPSILWVGPWITPRPFQEHMSLLAMPWSSLPGC